MKKTNSNKEIRATKVPVGPGMRALVAWVRREIIRDNQKKYHASKKGKAALRKSQVVYLHSLRSKVIALYTRGKNVCVKCGRPVKELHHTDPKDAIYERERFGSNTNPAAMRYKLKMYSKNKKYIQPVCKKCHLKIHVKLRKAVK